MLATYIQLLLVGVPLVLLAAHWREAWDVLDRWFGDLDFGRAGRAKTPTRD